MIKHNLKIFSTIILGFAFLIYGVIFYFTQDFSCININKAISHATLTISINAFFWLVFVKWIWKWKIFYPWLVQFPNLNGKWNGSIQSNWENKKLDPINITVEIEQSFLYLNVCLITEESKSQSIASVFNIDFERGIQQLLYTYNNIPKVGIRKTSAIHYGSVLLNFKGFNVIELDGEYWTSRNTYGEIKLKKDMPSDKG
jgi:hypothetical protein